MEFEKTFNLIAQTPHIHFQGHNVDACLRASEVKPKLDKYLIKKCQEKKIAYSEWLIPDQAKALNYKLRIIPGNNRRGTMTIGNFKIFYGNQGLNLNEADQNANTNEAYKYKDIIFRNCSLKVICFYPELLELIDSYIGDFFILNNFGSMQSKGFGSYTVSGKDIRDDHIVDLLIEDSDSRYCYKFAGQSTPTGRAPIPDLPATFETIKAVYSLMKSGINRPNPDPSRAKYKRSIFVKFAHSKELGNEKAKLKQEGLAPALVTHVRNSANSKEDKNKTNEEIRYVKALLGVCEKLEFLNDPQNRKDKTIIECKDKDHDDKVIIERFASPIRFKVINNTVYFVAYKLDEKIFDRNFAFKLKNHPDTPPVELSTPTKADLGDNYLSVIQEFLEYAYENHFKVGAEDYYLGTFRETQLISSTLGNKSYIKIIKRERSQS